MDEQELRSDDGAITDQVVEELRKVAFASFGDVAEVVDVQNWLDGIPLEDLPAVASIRIKPVTSGVERDIKMYDKLKALEMLARILGMYSDEARAGGEVPVIVDDIPRSKQEGAE